MRKRAWCRGLGGLIVLLVGILLVGCAHTYQFDPSPSIDPLRSHPLEGNSIAHDVSLVPKSYSGSASGHSFELTGIRAQAQEIVRRAFAEERLVEDPADADVVLRQELQLDMQGGFTGTRCVATVRWEIVEDGAVVAEGAATRQANAAVMQAGGTDCEIASLDAFDDALADAFSKM
jgi:hypothetical protein